METTASVISPRIPTVPEYKSHKRVWALEIKAVNMPVDSTDTQAEIVFVDKRYHPISWNKHFHGTATPQAGWYYVIYADGFRSFSPKKSFEEGYTFVNDEEDMLSVDTRMTDEFRGEGTLPPSKASIQYAKQCCGSVATEEEIARDQTPSHVPAPDAGAPPAGSVVIAQDPEQKAQQAKITGYRTLSVDEIELMNEIKAKGLELEHLVNSLRNHADTDKRWVSIGATDLQTGLMALTRSVARPTTFA